MMPQIRAAVRSWTASGSGRDTHRISPCGPEMTCRVHAVAAVLAGVERPVGGHPVDRDQDAVEHHERVPGGLAAAASAWPSFGARAASRATVSRAHCQARIGLLTGQPRLCSMARESPGSGDDLSPDGRRGWGDRTVKEDDVALKNDRIYRTEFANPEAAWSYS
jgi:hypothetical protein